MLVGCRSCRSSGRPSTSKLERIMTKAADDVIEKQTKINGSLVDLETERQRLGRGGDPLDPVDLRTAAFVPGC